MEEACVKKRTISKTDAPEIKPLCLSTLPPFDVFQNQKILDQLQKKEFGESKIHDNELEQMLDCLKLHLFQKISEIVTLKLKKLPEFQEIAKVSSQYEHIPITTILEKIANTVREIKKGDPDSSEEKMRKCLNRLQRLSSIPYFLHCPILEMDVMHIPSHVNMDDSKKYIIQFRRQDGEMFYYINTTPFMLFTEYPQNPFIPKFIMDHCLEVSLQLISHSYKIFIVLISFCDEENNYWGDQIQLKESFCAVTSWITYLRKLKVKV